MFFILVYVLMSLGILLWILQVGFRRYNINMQLRWEAIRMQKCTFLCITSGVCSVQSPDSWNMWCCRLGDKDLNCSVDLNILPVVPRKPIAGEIPPTSSQKTQFWTKMLHIIWRLVFDTLSISLYYCIILDSSCHIIIFSENILFFSLSSLQKKGAFFN